MYRRFGVVLAVLSFAALATAARAATQDPYTGGGVTPGGGGAGGSLHLSVTLAHPHDRVRIQGCGFTAGGFLRFTLNPGDRQNPGVACANATALGRGAPVVRAGTAGGHERLAFELAQPAAPCAYDHPVDANPPDTTSGGGFASTNADGHGCIDTYVTIPALDPGQYELCGVPVGQPTVCAAIRVVTEAATETPLGGTSKNGLARTGLELLPWVLAGIVAILVGRQIVKRSRRIPQE